jgi:hypothetical protein
MDEKELISKAMAVLGSRTSARKKISSRENAKRPRKNARGKKKKRRAKVEEPQTVFTHGTDAEESIPRLDLKPADSNIPAKSEETPEININKEVAPSEPIGDITFHEEGN